VSGPNDRPPIVPPEAGPLGPPPIEPLGDIAWSRIERNLWAQLDAGVAEIPRAPRRTRWPYYVVPAATAAAAAVIAIAIGGGDAGSGGRARELDGPARVVSGDAPSSITLGDAHVTLDPDSAVVMQREAAAPRALLERGGAWFAIAPRTGRTPFVVSAGEITIRVVGTRFHVARSGEVISVEVEHGIVEVQHRETVAELRAGQRWTSAPGTSEARRGIIEDEIEIEIDLIDLIEPRTPTRTRPRTRPQQPGEPTEQIEPDPRTRFAQLSAQEARDPRAALIGYLELARGGDVWAELSLFAAGRLAHERRDPRAKALLSIYLRRYPRGANVDDARELLARLRTP
jgi:hypothetical protein